MLEIHGTRGPGHVPCGQCRRTDGQAMKKRALWGHGSKIRAYMWCWPFYWPSPQRVQGTPRLISTAPSTPQTQTTRLPQKATHRQAPGQATQPRGASGWRTGLGSGQGPRSGRWVCFWDVDDLPASAPPRIPSLKAHQPQATEGVPEGQGLDPCPLLLPGSQRVSEPDGLRPTHLSAGPPSPSREVAGPRPSPSPSSAEPSMRGHLSLLPAFLALWAIAGVWIVFGISVANRSVDLSEGFPFISVCGSDPPQSCLFSQVLNAGAAMGKSSPASPVSEAQTKQASPQSSSLRPRVRPQLSSLKSGNCPLALSRVLPFHHLHFAGDSSPLPCPPSCLDLHCALPPAPGLGRRNVSQPVDPVVGTPLCSRGVHSRQLPGEMQRAPGAPLLVRQLWTTIPSVRRGLRQPASEAAVAMPPGTCSFRAHHSQGGGGLHGALGGSLSGKLEKHQKPIHLVGAFLAFIMGNLYFWLQLLLSWRMKGQPQPGAPWIWLLRLSLCSLCSILTVAMIILYFWPPRSASAICEWAVAMLLFTLFGLFAVDFSSLDSCSLSLQPRQDLSPPPGSPVSLQVQL
ncbi:Hypothetical predicted protein [Marmota monax]|uniref:CWH43-like N-terminal domain-containing protein n=1 Tax=Marmota monax TaxID=9995 RepID=A0A5E4CDT0_MARMO|nr:Hypothetical predicted protein [Marmota monax]